MSELVTLDLFQVIRHGSIAEWEEAFDPSALNLLDEGRQNLLHEAVSSRRNEIGSFLIEQGISLNQQDNAGLTPLHYAIAHRARDLALQIISAGANVNVEDVHGNNPLWTAVL